MFEKVEVPTPIDAVVEDKKAKKERLKREKENKKKDKEKAKKDKKRNNKKKGLSIAAFIIPLLFSLALIAGLYILIGNTTESTVDTINVMYASQSVPKNTYIPAEKYGEYFKVASTDISLIPETAITSPNILPEKGVYIENALVPNQMIYIDDLSENDPVMDKYVDAKYETSIAVNSFKAAMSGQIRKGDIINVYAQDPVTDELILLATNVYVENAYDANGNICSSDKDVAVSFNIWTTSEDIEGINLAITLGNIQLYLTEQ